MANLIEFLDAISDETRLRIMVLLSQRGMCVCEICDVLGESQPKVSRHLARLRDAGWVRAERQGLWVFYYINLNNNMSIELMDVIVKNLADYNVLKNDMEKLRKKINESKLCK